MRWMSTLIAVGLLASCTVVRGSGDVQIESRSISEFHGIDLQGSGEVIVSIDGTETLEIEAQENLLEYLTTDVENGWLTLSTKTGTSIQTSKNIRYRITADSLDGIEVSGSGEVEVVGITGPSMSVVISGSGSVSLAGAVDQLEVDVSGSGRFDGEDLAASTAGVSISGSGSALVNAADKLDVSISGSGSVSYLGDPTVNSDVSGSGSINRR